MELCNAVNQLWHEVNAYIRGKQAQTVLQFEGPKEDQEAAREVR